MGPQFENMAIIREYARYLLTFDPGDTSRAAAHEYKLIIARLKEVGDRLDSGQSQP